MKIIEKIKRIAAVTLCLGFAATANAEITGIGTEKSPYIIASVDDWQAFAEIIASGNMDRSAYYKLSDEWDNSESPITRMVSTDDTSGKCFDGIFDGNGKTLTVNITATAENAGLFCYIEGATFKNLTIAGTVSTSAKYAAGFAGCLKAGKNRFENCVSAVTIDSSVNGEGAHGGFIGVTEWGTAIFEGCVFNGKLLGTSTTSCSGFVGYSENLNDISFTDCLFIPTEVTMSETNSATFNRNGTTSYTRCYYTQSFGTAQGVLVSKNIPEKGLYGETITATDGNTYYPVVVVSGIPAGYAYTGSAISLGEKVTKGGETLAKGTDYIVQIADSQGASVDNLVDKGTYTITVTGKGAYSGSVSFTCAVVDVDSTLKCDPDDNSWYVNMPTTGEVKLSNVSKLSSFKVYDDGGKNGDYSKNCDGTLVINVPEDYMLSLSGTVSSESLSDCLYVYDGSSASATKLVEISETEPTSITAKSSGTSLTLCFMSDSMIQKAGLDLTVTISKCNSLVFDANGGSGSMKNIYFKDSTAKSLTENTFTREGYTFLGWNTKADGTGTSYADGADFSMITEENEITVTLYAQWDKAYTVVFDANGGTGDMESLVFVGTEEKALTENAFTCKNHIFLEWNTTADGKGTSYANKAEFSLSDAEAGATITLYAQWIEVVTLTAKADPYTKGAYYTTFYDSTVSYTVDENTEAYYVDDNENGVFTLVKADDGIIKAGAGVILKSTSAAITLVPVNTNGTAESLLTGTDTEKTLTATSGKEIYILGLGENGVRFYRVTGEITIGAHKAWIERDLRQ